MPEVTCHYIRAVLFFFRAIFITFCTFSRTSFLVVSRLKAHLHDKHFRYGTLKFRHAGQNFLARLLRLHDIIFVLQILFWA